MMEERQDLIWKTPEVKCTCIQGGLFSSEKVDLPLKMRSIWVDTRMMKKQWPMGKAEEIFLERRKLCPKF